MVRNGSSDRPSMCSGASTPAMSRKVGARSTFRAMFSILELNTVLVMLSTFLSQYAVFPAMSALKLSSR